MYAHISKHATQPDFKYRKWYLTISTVYESISKKQYTTDMYLLHFTSNWIVI